MRIKAPNLGFSVRHLNSEARTVDWQDVRGEDSEGFSPILPAPRYSDWQDRDSDAPPRIERMKGARVMSDDDREAFEETEAYYEWRDSFEPMMNYAWPVDLAYGVDAQDAANLIEEHGGACVLLELSPDADERVYGGDGPEYVIALTGGGMNLSDHLAAAYLACGCVPPERILSGLAGVVSPDKARRLPLRAAYAEAARYYARTARALRDQSKRVHGGTL